MSKTDISAASKKQRNAIKRACIENAKWLLMEANENFRRQNFGLSAFLAITAYEESLKFSLLNSNASKVLSDTEFNRIASSHVPKLLSKHAVIAFYTDGKKIKQEYTLPKKIGSLEKEINEIVNKRERSLYVDFKNSKLNIPTSMNASDAMEEINRANRSIEDETASEQLFLLLEKRVKEIRNQKIVKPKIIFDK